MIAPAHRTAFFIGRDHFAQRLILPPRLTKLSAALDVDRSPMRVTCECGHFDVICVPNAHGRIDWTCACGRQHAIGFKPEGEQAHDQWTGVLQREPIEQLCQSPKCGQRDCIVLPAGDGELRWTCAGKCNATWGLRFRADGQVDLFKVSDGRPTDPDRD